MPSTPLSAPFAAVAADDGTIRIGGLSTLAGPYAEGGKESMRGIELALSELDYRVAGNKIVLVKSGSDGNPDRAVAAAKDLINRDNVDIVIGAATLSDMARNLEQTARETMPAEEAVAPFPAETQRVVAAIATSCSPPPVSSAAAATDGPAPHGGYRTDAFRSALEAPDVILLDVMMPEMDGYQVLEILKGEDTTRDIPVILITGLTATEEEEKGLALGAADYITKPFHASIVALRVRNHVRAARQRHLLEQMAMLDPLCEIPNRRRLSLTMKENWPAGSQISIMMIDVDHFKLYNDFYGHAAGDTVLKKIAATLHGQLQRYNDLAVRYGGEEFALFLPDTDREGGILLARRLLESVLALALPHERSPVGPVVSISMGGATTDIATSGAAPDDLLERADRQLYLAKGAGRNRVAWEGENIHMEKQE